ncbi:MAG: acetate--CoA ligase [Alphaproteobacteria bacterium]
MSRNDFFKVKEKWKQNAHIDNDQYLDLYQQSIDNPDAFWAEKAKIIDWIEPFTKVKNTYFSGTDVSIKWFEDGTLNACWNCVDRHLGDNPRDIAIFWEGNEPGESRSITWRELHEEICRLANVLKARGVKKGDPVILYLPPIPEAIISMLACARIGAVHSVVFGGFSSKALASRIEDCQAKTVITADYARRAKRSFELKENVDTALKSIQSTHKVDNVIVVKRTGEHGISMRDDGRDIWYHDAIANASPLCPIEEMKAEDPLFILYTSGSTGKPKGVVHTTGGYMVYAALTHKYIFDYQKDDVWWCTADVGWITGHTYMVYGPLANGAKTVVFEGVPYYPDASRVWRIVDRYKVTLFYTAPTAIRMLQKEGNDMVTRTSRSSLRVIGSVGEPINNEAWQWYYSVVGNENCPVIDSWWQTETGGIMITPLPGATDLKPCSATRPFFGIRPQIVSKEGEILEGEAEGILNITDSWPGQARTLYNDHDRFIETYFSQYPGSYHTGDGAKRDEDGYYWITGRIDDVINISGKRLGTAEIEDALDEVPDVAEAAVVGWPHPVKGEGIYAYVTLKEGYELTEDLLNRMKQSVREQIGGIAIPDKIQFAPTLPRTRSGKIMRRILRKIAANDVGDFGDISTLSDPDIVQILVDGRLNR